MIFDEIQLVPEIFRAIKLRVDENRNNYGNYILTGSAQFLFLKSASKSLAGRIGLMSLLPFQYLEIPDALKEFSIFKGSFPENVMKSYQDSSLWYSSYVSTYLNKDLRTLANIGDVRDSRRLIQLLAAQISKTLDLTFYAKNIGVSVPTIKRWVSILEASYIIFLLPPFYNNFGKRIVKSPKIYFYHTGLVSYLTGLENFEHYDKGPLAGPLFENYIISEIYKNQLHLFNDYQLYHLRTQDQVEVNLVVDQGLKQTWIEIKKSATFKTSMLSGIKSFKKDEDDAYLIYQGSEGEHQNIHITSYQKFLSNTTSY